MRSGATFGGEGDEYRYHLWREWLTGPRCLFVMLNPSTADARKDDPTIRRCIGFARAWGFSGVEVVNLFALRSRDPQALYVHGDPVGPQNDEFILRRAMRCARVVVAWSRHGAFQDRGCVVARTLSHAHVTMHCFAVTKNGHPAHPLYQPNSIELKEYRWPG